MSPSSPDEIDLWQYVQILWRRRFRIAFGTLVVVAITVAASALAPRQYTARSALSITSSKLDLSKLDLRQTGPFNTASYRPILESQNLAAKVVQEFELDRKGVAATRFFGSALKIEEVRNSSVFLLNATFDNPELAAKVANRVAVLAVEESRRLNQDEAIRVRNDLKAQVDEAFASLQEAETKLSGYKRSGQIDSVKQSTESRQEPTTRKFDAEATLKQLETDAEMARKVYQDIGIAYQTVRLQVAGRSAELQVLESAIPPDRPLPRNLTRNAVVAFLVSLVLFGIVALAYDLVIRKPAAA